MHSLLLGKEIPKDTEVENAEVVDEYVCYVCGADYDDDDNQGVWIGCDNDDCGRWFHYWCVGFKRKPSSRKAANSIIIFYYYPP